MFHTLMIPSPRRRQRSDMRPHPKIAPQQKPQQRTPPLTPSPIRPTSTLDLPEPDHAPDYALAHSMTPAASNTAIHREPYQPSGLERGSSGLRRVLVGVLPAIAAPTKGSDTQPLFCLSVACLGRAAGWPSRGTAPPASGRRGRGCNSLVAG
jgi:hypothetical protein